MQCELWIIKLGINRKDEFVHIPTVRLSFNDLFHNACTNASMDCISHSTQHAYSEVYHMFMPSCARVCMLGCLHMWMCMFMWNSCNSSSSSSFPPLLTTSTTPYHLPHPHTAVVLFRSLLSLFAAPILCTSISTAWSPDVANLSLLHCVMVTAYLCFHSRIVQDNYW